MLGGICLLAAAVFATRVHDPGNSASDEAVLAADEHEPLTVTGSVQPVPSTGLADRA
jgi:hypothetical protein